MKHEGGKDGKTTRGAPQQGSAVGGEASARAGSQRELAGRRYGTGATLQAPNKPPLPPPPPAARSALHEASARLLGQHGERISAGAAKVGIPDHAAAAVLLTEGQFAAAPVDDRMALRFEPYAFFQQTGRWLVATHKDQAAEYKAFQEAQAIDPAAAHTSVRMGVAQLAGTEAHAAGFADAQAMLSALQANPQAQVDSFFQVVATSEDLRGALASEDWRAVASLRAGPGYGALGYDDALAAGAAAWKNVAHGGDDDGSDIPKKPRRRK
jgi:hypothetical protein